MCYLLPDEFNTVVKTEGLTIDSVEEAWELAKIYIYANAASDGLGRDLSTTSTTTATADRLFKNVDATQLRQQRRLRLPQRPPYGFPM
jgi:hypothetical protein